MRKFHSSSSSSRCRSGGSDGNRDVGVEEESSVYRVQFPSEPLTEQTTATASDKSRYCVQLLGDGLGKWDGDEREQEQLNSTCANNKRTRTLSAESRICLCLIGDIKDQEPGH